DQKNISAIWGLNGGEDSNITVVVDYFSNSPLTAAERGLDSANLTSIGGPDYDLRSSRSSPGRYGLTVPNPDFPGPRQTPTITQTAIDPACPPDPRHSHTNPTC